MTAMTIIYQTCKYSNFNTGYRLGAGEAVATGIEFQRLPLPCISALQASKPDKNKHLRQTKMFSQLMHFMKEMIHNFR
jgi:hypothetical protein